MEHPIKMEPEKLAKIIEEVATNQLVKVDVSVDFLFNISSKFTSKILW